MRTFNYKGTKVTVKVITSITPNHIQLYEEETSLPFATATVKIPELQNLEGYVAVKNYSENEGMLDFLIKNGIVEKPITYVESSHVNFPICKIK